MPRLGARLEVVNSDERRHRLRLTAAGATTPIVDAPMPLVGQRFATTLASAGVFRLSTAADPDDPAWVVVPPHPYYALTDRRGEAVLTDVPAGRYQLVVWHRPFAAGEPPRTVKQPVVVDSGSPATVTVSMAPKK
jgi:hypothetical protein